MTDDARALVARMSAEGAAHPAIADAIGCSVPTLRKYFRDDLANRLGEANLFAVADGAAPAPSLPSPRKAKRRGAGGRPQRLPTADERRRVAELVAVDYTAARIAVVLKASEPWVRQHFAVELETGSDIKRAEVFGHLYRTAAKGNVSAQKALIEIFNRSDLEKLQRSFTQTEPKPAKTGPVGKKESAEQAAHDVVANSDWSHLLGPASKPN